MNPEITKIIDQYIQGELSESDRLAFEKKLAESDVLKREVELQQTVYEVAKRAALRTKVLQAGKSYHLTKKLQVAGIAAVILATVAALTFYFSRASGKFDHEITAEVKHLIEKLKAESPIENLQSEFFIWNGNDSVVLSRQGVLLSIPENAFLLHGQNYAKQAVIQWQEALDGATMMKSGLSTMSGDKLLETQGMFGFQAFTPEGEKLEVNPKIGVYVQVPVEEYKQGMQLFDGKKNKEGIIDWQNPKPLLKIPVPVDMALLDFYPKDYEAELNTLKLRKDKQYRDSLYLSFAGHGWDDTLSSEARLETKEMGKNLYATKCATCHSMRFDGTGPKLANVREKWIQGGAKAGSIYQWVRDWNSIVYKDPYAREITKLKPTAMNRFPELTNEQIDGIFDYVDGQSTECGISPEKVMAFWNPRFNNTNLATREFEKRIRVIHSLCNDAILEKYVQNLSRPISEIDQEINDMGYYQFYEFAAEQVGAVNPNNPHTKNLGNFYQKAIKQFRTEAQNNRERQRKKEEKWDNVINKGRDNEKTRTENRESQALMEEYEFNLKNVEKQLGKTIGFQIHGGGTIFNIDKYVMDATIARSSATIVDPETGKTAEITYNDFAFEVNNSGQYQQIYAYLFPSGINSYQRISGSEGKFSYPLNGDMTYDLAVIGISEEGYAYFQKQTLDKGNLGKIQLENVSEAKFNASIKQLNAKRLWSPININDEIDWLNKEQQNYKEQKNRENQAIFRRRIHHIVFPCCVVASGEVAVTDAVLEYPPEIIHGK